MIKWTCNFCTPGCILIRPGTGKHVPAYTPPGCPFDMGMSLITEFTEAEDEAAGIPKDRYERYAKIHDIPWVFHGEDKEVSQ